MKRLQCEMCGSPELVKKDGLYECQHCGTKYTVEEAKKLLIDISGSTVKIDRSEQLANLYELARRARTEENVSNAVKYYEMILLQDPYSWEACLCAAVYKVWGAELLESVVPTHNLKGSVRTAVGLVQERVADPEEQLAALKDICSYSKAAVEVRTM